MTATTFDTLATARELENAGMDHKQAEAVAEAIRAGQGDLATKADLNAVRGDLATLEGRMTATLYCALWTQAAGIVGAIAALAGVVVAFASLTGITTP